MKPLILILLTIIDSFFTIISLQLAVATEANPIMAYVIQHGGYVGLVIVKFCVVMAVIAVLEVVKPKYPVKIAYAYLIAIGIHIPLTVYHLTIFYVVGYPLIASR